MTSLPMRCRAAHRFVPRRLAPLLLGLVLAAGDAAAQLDVTSIPFAPHGPGLSDDNGAPTPLTATSLLVPSRGADGLAQTADDLTLLVTGIDTVPVVTPLATPFLLGTDGASRVVRLTATRALVASAGPDGVEETADDVVYLLDDLGSTSLVVPIVVGFLGFDATWRPVRLADDTAVVVSGTSELVLLRGLGGTIATTRLAAPGLRTHAGHPVALDPTSALLPAGSESPGDTVYLFRDLGGTNTRTDLATPHLDPSPAGVPEPIGATRAMVVSAGADATAGTADDGVYLLDGLGTTNAVTFIAVGGVLGGGGSAVTVLNPDLVVIATRGADLTAATADDLVLFISGIGGSNTRSGTIVGGLAGERGSRPVRLGPTAFIVTTTGPDFVFGTTDDTVTTVTNVGTLNGLTDFEFGGLDAGETTQVSVIDETAFAVVSGGPDAVLAAGEDDTVNVVTGFPRATLLRTAPVVGDADSAFDPHARPHLLGTNRVVFVSGGPDATQGSGDDDLLQVIAGPLPLRHLECYDVRRGPFPSRGVALEDQFGPSAARLRRPRRLCNPANKDREDPAAAADPRHLVGYEIRQFDPRFLGVRKVEVTNQFGTVTIDLVRPEVLLVPSAKSETDPATPIDGEGDHFKCYRVKGARESVRDVRLEDQFGERIIDVKRPRRLCTPVDKDGEGIFDTVQHLLCYKIRAPRFPAAPGVFIHNQFGDDALEPRRARELCVPSFVAVPDA